MTERWQVTMNQGENQINSLAQKQCRITDVCFFCEKAAGYQDPLHSISTTSAGHSLRMAIKIAKKDRLQVKLSSAIDSEDAVAIDIKYHKSAGHVMYQVCCEKGQATKVIHSV